MKSKIRKLQINVEQDYNLIVSKITEIKKRPSKNEPGSNAFRS